jgi:Zn-dependent M28 family amino/carboxypeptidase
MAALLAIARRLVGTRPQRRLIFTAFADEELGVRGATEYCRVHEESLGQMIAMFNLDALAWAYPGTRSIILDPAIQTYVVERATEVGWIPERIEDPRAFSGDHAPFTAHGVPVCWAWRFPPQNPYYHSAGDQLVLLDMGSVSTVADVTAHSVFSLAHDTPMYHRTAP